MATNKATNIQTVNDQKEQGLNTEMNWYVVQTYVGFEDAVRRTLESKISNMHLADKIQEIYIPTQKVEKVNSKGEKKEKEVKVYPGYIYVRMVLDREVAYALQHTNYISRVTGTGDMAVPLEAGYVENLKIKLLEDTEVKPTGNTQFSIGDLVRVIDGPFKDMQGNVSGVDDQNNRLMVLLVLFDRETVVEIDFSEAVKVL